MRTLSIMAFTSFLVLWGVYSYLRNDKLDNPQATSKIKKMGTDDHTDLDNPVNRKKRHELDQIGAVINEKNVEIDQETIVKIKTEKKIYDVAQNLKEKVHILEQSYMDHASSIKDIKRLQIEISEIKNKLKLDLSNTERWDPKFVYYLMIQENYTYQEIDNIKSLSENGINNEEFNYINNLIKEDAFMDRITNFKGQNDGSRSIASTKKKIKEKDEFIDSPEVGSNQESKLIEMDYNHDEKEEIVYGNNQ